MDASHSRRTVMRMVAGAGPAPLAVGAANRAAAQQYGVDSGGIGLLRVDFEEAYGVGSDVDGVTEYANVEVGIPGATMYTDFRGEVVDHIEVRWSEATQSGGVDWATANQAATFLLPVDAQHLDQYWVPATPGGPIEPIAHTYESAQLTEANYGLGRVLLIYQRKYVQMNASAPLEVIVPAVTLTMAEVPQ
jgi:hypothetical protein